MQELEQIHQNSIREVKALHQKAANKVSEIGVLHGNLININEALNKKVAKMIVHTYSQLEKIFKKDVYIQALFKNILSPEVIAFHQTDLLNKKISLRIIFTLFERMLGKM